MDSIRGAIESTVPISSFNRGLAGKIFEDVKRTGAKVVMKNNTPECVLMSPRDYISFLDELNDARLLMLAAERMARYDPSKTVSQEEVDREFGITPEDLEGMDEVEIE